MKISFYLSLFFLTILTTINSWANTHGGGEAGIHHPGPGSLIAPAFNFFVLFGFLIYKIKTPMNKAFERKSKKISEILDRASVKAKEAQILLSVNDKKLSDVENETASIMKIMEDDSKKMITENEKEIKEKTEKMQSEAIARVETEKKKMISDLNKELVNEVMKKTKNLITSNSAVQKSLNQKMAKEITL